MIPHWRVVHHFSFIFYRDGRVCSHLPLTPRACHAYNSAGMAEGPLARYCGMLKSTGSHYLVMLVHSSLLQPSTDLGGTNQIDVRVVHNDAMLSLGVGDLARGGDLDLFVVNHCLV